MALRFRYRHVHATLFDYVRAHLVALGWGDSSLPADDPANLAINFGGVAMTFIDSQPDESGLVIVPQTVAVTLGDEPASEDLELGAGLTQVPYPLYVDVFGTNQAIAQAITSDLKDILEDIYIPVMDHLTDPPTATDEVIEIWHEDVESGRPQASLTAQDFKRYWRVTRATARVDYLV
jgi:hypothetical protein